MGSNQLSTIFLTGPGGVVYELPKDVATEYLLTAPRIAQLGGHLPIEPYNSGIDAEDVTGHQATWATTEGGVIDQAVGLTWHSEPKYGCYLGTDNAYHLGWHVHPSGDEIGVEADAPIS